MKLSLYHVFKGNILSNAQFNTTTTTTTNSNNNNNKNKNKQYHFIYGYPYEVKAKKTMKNLNYCMNAMIRPYYQKTSKFIALYALDTNVKTKGWKAGPYEDCVCK